MVVLTGDGLVFAWGTGAARLFGLSPAEAVGHDLRRLLSHLPDAVSTIERALGLAGRGQSWHGVVCLGLDRGQAVSVVCEPLADDQGRALVALSAFPLRTDGLELMNEAGSRIGSTLDLSVTAREILDVTVPRFADIGSIYVLERLLADEDSPGSEADGAVVVRRLAVTFADEDPPEWNDAFPVNEVIVYAAKTPYARCSTTGHPTVFTSEDIRSMLSQRTGRPFDGLLDHVSLLAVPLTARGRVLGFAAFSRQRGRLPFSEPDISLAMELAGRAATCIDNARLYRREHRTAETLRHSLLPARIIAPPGLEIAHRYVPADDVTQIGGDWYDAVPLPGERVALVIGDAMGHGVTAAAAMGQLRVAARTLASLNLPPAEVLSRLDAIAQDLDAAQFATCIYLTCDPATRRCVIASAGHPPALLALPDGTTEILRQPPGLPLGVGEGEFQATDVVIPPGATLVLYTDGLVESRHRDLDAGITALRTALVGPHAGLEATADAVLDTLHDQRGGDDIALLLVRPN